MKKLLILTMLFSAMISNSVWAVNVRTRPERVFKPLQHQDQNQDQDQDQAPRSRGMPRNISPGPAPREASQDLVPTAYEIPDYVRDFDLAFAMQKEGELVVPYGHDTDPNSFQFFLKDQFEGQEKIQMMSLLGFEWEFGPPQKAPSWLRLVWNYRRQMLALKRDPRKFLVPAVVIYRTVVTDPAGEKEYLMIDPLTEKFPPASEGWQALTSAVEFNLPFEVIVTGMQQGKFPLLDAVHDVSHQVAFLRYPEWTQALVESLQKYEISEFTPAFKKRMYWLTESLSLPQAEKRNDVESFLHSAGRPVESLSISLRAETLRRESLAKVSAYATKLSNFFESTLADVSGGNSSSPEKYFYVGEALGIPAADIAEGHLKLTKSTNLFNIIKVADSYFKDQPIHFNYNKKRLTNETVVFSFSTLSACLHFLAETLATANDQTLAEIFSDPTQRFSERNAMTGLSQLKPGAKEELRDLLIQFAATTEYALQQSMNWTLTDWAHAFLQPDLKPTHPIARFVKEVFQNRIVTERYLGTGEKPK